MPIKPGRLVGDAKHAAGADPNACSERGVTSLAQPGPALAETDHILVAGFRRTRDAGGNIILRPVVASEAMRQDGPGSSDGGANPADDPGLILP